MRSARGTLTPSRKTPFQEDTLPGGHPSRKTGLLEGGAGRWRRLLLLVALLVALPGAAHAQDENHAGLVVVFGDGRVERQCVAFAEDTVTGYQLLQRSGLPLSVEAGAIGPTVCSIDKEGCSFPAESCFCRCQGSPCIYWSYWRLQGDGAWRYQALGAGNTKVRSGDVEGWRWAAGTTQNAEEPPAVSYAEICGESSPETIASAPSLTATAQSAPAVTATAVATGTAVRIFTPFGNVEPDNKAAAGAGDAGGTGLDLIWIVLVGVIVVPAAALVVLGLRRRRG
jgi:hypothetical protein